MKRKPTYDELKQRIQELEISESNYKKAEQALRKSNEQHKTLIENIPQKIFYKDRHSVYISCNDNYANDLGIKPEEITGKTDFDFYPEELAEKYRADDKKFMSEGKTTELEEKYVQGKKEFWVHTIKTPVKDDQGEVIGIQGIFWDITKRKQIENALQLNEERLKVTASIAKVGGWEIDLKGNTLSWTPETFRIYELETEKAPDVEDAIKFYHPDDQAKVSNAVEHAIEQGEGFDFEARLITAKKNIRWVRAIGNAVKIDGEMVGLQGMVQDITKRKEAEEALIESEKELNRAQAITHIGSWSVNLVDGTFYHSDETKRIFGYEPSEYTLSVEDAINAYHPDDQADVIKYFNRAVETGEDYEFELRIVQPGGNIRNVFSQGFTQKDNDGKVVRVYGVFQDITERKQVEEALSTTIERLKGFDQHSTEGVYRVDLIKPVPITLDRAEIVDQVNKYAVVGDVNDSLARMYGLKPQDMIGRPAVEFAPDYGERAVIILEHEGYRVVNEETEDIDKNGQAIFLIENYHGIIKDGCLVSIWGAQNDITERKLLEKALEKRLVALTRPLDDPEGITFEEMFNLKDIQRLQDEFADATGVASIITHTDGTPITKPSNFCRLCSDIIRKTDKGLTNCFKSDAVLGKANPEGPTIQPCLSGGLWDAGAGISIGGKHIANWLIGQVRDETQTDEQMIAYAHKIGAESKTVVEAFHEVPAMSQEKFKSISQALFTLANQLSHVAYQNVQQARFISERKRLEEKREIAMQEAQKANRVKDLFLANMSHEIRTPLNGILGFTNMLQELYLDEADETGKDYFRMVEQSGKRLMRTIHEILDISQIEAQTFEAKFENLDLRQILDDQLLNYKIKAADKNLEIHTYVNTSNAVFINADEYCINQILINLLDNAIKYTLEGSITVEMFEKDGKYILSIADTGIGISDEYRDKLFLPFSQESEGYTKDFQGVGLGLALVKKYCEINQISIEVESQKGQGTTFLLKFDSVARISRKQESVAKITQEPLPKIKEQKPLILVVEDDYVSQKLVNAYLAPQFKLEYARSVAEAQSSIENKIPALILLDLSLDGKEDGLDLMTFIRSNPEFKQIPVIATTAHAFTSDRDNCLEAGCDDYLPKPFTSKLLNNAISKFRLDS